MFHFVHPTSYGHQLPSRARNFYGQRRPISFHAGSGFGSELETLTAENDRLEARIAALEERARYEDALAREHKRREAAAQRLAQLEARQSQRVLPSTTARAVCAPQESANAHCRQACQQGAQASQAPTWARRGGCRRRSAPQSAEVVDDVVNLLNTIFGGQEQPQRQASAPKPAKPATEAKEDPFHLAELLQRREEFLSLFTNQPVKKESNQPSSPTASGSNVKLSDTLQEDAIPAGVLHARSRASAVLNSLSNQFSSLKSSFIIPAAPPAGFEFKKVSSDSSSPALAFNPVNAPILDFEQQLTKLLGKADEIDSAGSEAVRDQRKALVKQVGEELEKLEQWKAEVWASQSSPVQRPVELEEVQGKGKGKARPVSIEVEEDEDDRSTVRIIVPSTSAPASPSSLRHHSALFGEAPVLDQIYPSPPSYMNTDNEEVVGYDVSFDAPAPAPASETTSVVADSAAPILPDTVKVAVEETLSSAQAAVASSSATPEENPWIPATANHVDPVILSLYESLPTTADSAPLDKPASELRPASDSPLRAAYPSETLPRKKGASGAGSGDEFELV